MTALHLKQLQQDIIEVISFLIAIVVIDMIVSLAVPVLLSDYWQHEITSVILENRYWVSRFCFAILLMVKLRRQAFLAAPIGLLGLVLPTFGGVFYLIVKTYGATRQQ